jgi:hypothetical protein
MKAASERPTLHILVFMSAIFKRNIPNVQGTLSKTQRSTWMPDHHGRSNNVRNGATVTPKALFRGPRAACKIGMIGCDGMVE